MTARPSRTEVLEREIDPLGPSNRCRDFDEDCEGIQCKVACWLYDPEQGWCPFLHPGD
jgi:hypothetical protein